MSFKDCIDNAEQANEITKKQADEARSLFDDVETDLKKKNVQAMKQSVMLGKKKLKD